VRRRPESVLFGGQPVITFRQEVDRRRFLTAAAIVGVGGTLAASSWRDPRALAQASAGDLDILNYALTLEYLEADFYRQGVDAGILSGRELELVTPIADHERAHVEALTQTVSQLGGTPAELPRFTYPEGTFTQRDTFLSTASTFEELGVTAYHGQITAIESTDLLAALSIAVICPW